MTKPTNNKLSPGFWLTLINTFKLGWYLLKDNTVSNWPKLIPLGILLYIFSPADFIPDVLPFLGQIDDLTLLFLAVRIFIQFSPEERVKFHKEKLKIDL